MKKILVMALLAAIIVSSCTISDNTSEIQYDIVGTVTEITTKDDKDVTSFLIESDSNQYDYDKAYVRVTEKTNIQLENSKEKLKSNSLQLGQTLGVVVDGDVAESYPVQVAAGQIVIFN